MRMKDLVGDASYFLVTLVHTNVESYHNDLLILNKLILVSPPLLETEHS